MRKQIALTVLALTTLAGVAFGDVTLMFNDNNGTANVGTAARGQTFTFDIFLVYNAPPPSNLFGYSLWFQSLVGSTPTGGIFTITGFDRTGSVFTDPQAGVFPDPMDNPMFADNDFDKGASKSTGLPGEGTGTYLAGRISIMVTNNAQIGQTYTIQNVFAPIGSGANEGHGSVAFGQAGAANDGVDIPSQQYFITIIPEPATWSLMALGGLACAGITMMRRRRV